MCFYEGFLALRFLLWLPTPTARVVGGVVGGVGGGGGWGGGGWVEKQKAKFC